MLLLLLSFYIHYDLLNCEEIVKAKHNESLRVDHHRQKLLQVNTLLEDLEHKTRKLSLLLADDHPFNDTRRKAYVLKSVMSETGQNIVYPDPAITAKPRFPSLFFKRIPSPSPGLNISPTSLLEKSIIRTNLKQVTSTPLSTSPSSTIKTTTLGPIARGWFDQIAPYTRVRKKKRTSSTSPSQATVHVPSGMTKPKSYRFSTRRDDFREEFFDDEHRSLHVTLAKHVSRPGGTPGIPHIYWTTTMTTAGDVLYGKIHVQKPSSTQPSNQRYQELMKQLGEGYLVVFGIEMFRLIAVKEKREVREVLAPAETIYNNSLESGRLVGVDNPFLTILGNLAMMTSKDKIDTLRTYSSMMFHSLLKRKEVLSPEVNSIIDQAELFYRDEAGKCLLRSLSPFEDYPKTNQSCYSICENLIESILQPFRRPADLKNRQELLTSINKAYNLPQFFSNRVVGTPTTLSLIGTTTSRIEHQPRRKRKKKHHHHKAKRKRKRHHKPEYHNTNTRPNGQDLDYKQPSYIEAITTKRYRPMNKSTNAFLWSKQTKIIRKRKLVHRRHKHRQQPPHADVASRIEALNQETRSTRPPRYQETFDDIVESIDQAMSQVIRKQFTRT